MTYNIDPILKKLPGHTSMLKEMVMEMIQQGRYGTCNKSQRVAAIYSPIRKNYILATNSPPLPFKCLQNDNCKKNCSKLAVHAEERAILKASKCGFMPKEGLHCFHLKIKDNVPVVSGKPSCIYCSRKMLEYGIGHVWLWQEKGWKSWLAQSFHADTIKNLGL